MKPRARRVTIEAAVLGVTALLFALFSAGCTEPPSPSRPELEPAEPGTTKVRVEILALIYDGAIGFRCEYEVLEDAGSFKRGQRGLSDSNLINLEGPILEYTRDRKQFRCVFHFTEKGSISAVSLEVVE